MSSSRNVSTIGVSIAILLLSGLPGWAQFVPNRYTLLLEDPPVSARFASREEMRTQAAEAYRRQVEARQAAVLRTLDARGITVTGSVSEVLNAVFVSAPADRVPELEAIPGVIGVRPMRRFKLALNKATQLMNAPAAWTALGGSANAGKGIKIAILDSGIDQTHPALQDSSLSMPAGFPLCTQGHPEDCAFTNSKVIVARSYVRQLAAGSDPANPAADSMPDDYSPRDRDGHGTAVASCAAANQATGAVTISGMAPKAYLGNYKIQGSPGVLDFSTDGLLIAAINDALKDGMDIANVSIGGPALTGALDTGAACGLTGNAPCDPVAAAYEAAVKAGMVVVASAGNDGYSGTLYPNAPTYNGISSPANAPSVIGVGATVNSHVLAASVSVNAASAPTSLKGIAAQSGDSVAPTSNLPSFSASDVVFPALSAPLVDVAQLGNDGYACTALPAFSLTDAFALIQRGPTGANACTFDTKATNAADAGAIGVIFYMADSSAPISPEDLGFNTSGTPFFGPTVMISNSDGQAIKTYIDANKGQSVTIDLSGREQDLAAYSQTAGISPALAGNQLAAYSSRGPAPDGIIKPDLVATSGVETDSSNFGPDSNDADLPVPGGLYTAAQRFDPNGGLYSVSGYTGIGGGTSFSAPMAAGAAALVKQAHPGFTATQIKSALMNSAAQDTATDSFGDPVDVESIGAGRLDAGAAMKATVTAEPSAVSFGFLKSGGLPLNKTITITNKGTSSVTLAVAVTPGGKAAAGATVAVDKPSLTLAAGASSAVTVTLSGTVPAAGQYNGAVTVTGTGVQSLRLPYMFIVGDGLTSNLIWFAGFSGEAGQDLGAAPIVRIADQFGAPVVGEPVSLSVSPRGAVTFKSVAGAPACSPNNSTTVTTCNTDNYGYAWVDVVLGNQSAAPTITITVKGQSPNRVTASISPQPTITTAGVTDAASNKSPISAGSYVAIFGSNLLDTNFQTNTIGDTGVPTADGTLPLVIDGTTVSFDVPSAGISLPGHLTFASSGQVNVQVPWELQGQSSVKVKVSVDDGSFLGNVVDVPLAQYTPAFFQGGGVVAAEDAQTGAIILPANKAKPGEILALYANGLGPVNNQPASGAQAPGGPNLATTKTTPTVTIGGQQAQVLFSGLAPGFAGEYQINVVVPAGLTGNQPVILTIGGQATPSVTLPIQ